MHCCPNERNAANAALPVLEAVTDDDQRTSAVAGHLVVWQRFHLNRPIARQVVLGDGFECAQEFPA
jgi:hypothetical protein